MMLPHRVKNRAALLLGTARGRMVAPLAKALFTAP
jgi:hypothetical protein